MSTFYNDAIEFYGISYNKLLPFDVSNDVLSVIRKNFFNNHKRQNDKVYQTIGTAKLKYVYNLQNGKPLKWKVYKNDKIVEQSIIAKDKTETIESYDDMGNIISIAHYDINHEWVNTEYVTSNGNINIFSAEDDSDKVIIAAGTNGEYTLKKFPEIQEDDLRQRVLGKVKNVSVTALTNQGACLFGTDLEIEEYNRLIDMSKIEMEEEKKPQVFISEEDKETGFNFKTNDFNIKKNLNATFDIDESGFLKVPTETENSPEIAIPEKADKIISAVKEDEGKKSLSDLISEAVQKIDKVNEPTKESVAEEPQEATAETAEEPIEETTENMLQPKDEITESDSSNNKEINKVSIAELINKKTMEIEIPSEPTEETPAKDADEKIVEPTVETSAELVEEPIVESPSEPIEEISVQVPQEDIQQPTEETINAIKEIDISADTLSDENEAEETIEEIVTTDIVSEEAEEQSEEQEQIEQAIGADNTPIVVQKEESVPIPGENEVVVSESQIEEPVTTEAKEDIPPIEEPVTSEEKEDIPPITVEEEKIPLPAAIDPMELKAKIEELIPTVSPESVDNLIEKVPVPTETVKDTSDDYLNTPDSPNKDEQDDYDESVIQADLKIISGNDYFYYFGDTNDNNMRDGYGRTAMSDGKTAYEGMYKDNKRSGFGSYYYKDGKACYVGDWNDNKRTGFGVGFRNADGSIHAGKWKDNKPEGAGVRFDKEGNLKSVCIYKNGKPTGFCAEIDENNSLSIFEIIDDEKQLIGSIDL